MNFFGQQKPKGRNPLAALMQPSLMEALGPGQGPEDDDEKLLQQMKKIHSDTPHNTLPNNGLPLPGPQYAQQRPPGAPLQDVLKLVDRDKPGFMSSLMNAVSPQTAPKQEPPVAAPEAPKAPTSDFPDIDLALEQADAIHSDTPSNTLPNNGLPLPPQTKDEQEKNLDLGMGGGLMSGALGATEGILQKYGKAAMTVQGAKNALKAEFQDTPELDQIISKTEAELAQTKANRKQPGVGEFIAMALMNLGGMHPRDSADMVLGLGTQRQDEMRLEDKLSQLEGGRASAKMQGRHELRGMERQDKYQNLQTALRQQEQGRKQANEDREFGFKGQKLGIDKLMQNLGQLRQQAGMATDPVQRKKLQDAIDKLDPYGQRQQPQPRPKDDRQSRMFGDLLSGGGYA